MSASAFWNVIGRYNQNTIIIQVCVLLLLAMLFIVSLKTKYANAMKFGLGLVNLFIALVFFGYYGTEPIQKFFALPLYTAIGLLFILDAIKNHDDLIEVKSIPQVIILFLFVVYPLISLILGNRYPKMVLHIMPCPVVTLSIGVYSMYRKKNIVLLILLAVWGLTGIKSVIFHAYEDLILLFAGIYCVYIIVQTIRRKNQDRIASSIR